MKILVVFTDNRPADRRDDWRHRLLHWALRRFLAPGFRHCFVVLPDAAGLTVLDQRSFGLCVWRLAGHGYLDDLALQERAGAVRLVPVDPPPGLPADAVLRGAPRLGYLSCVGLVENILQRRGLGPTPRMVWRNLTGCTSGESHGRQRSCTGR